jgi:response regulator RpfG family c-di-GMP phosphodiesterase
MSDPETRPMILVADDEEVNLMLMEELLVTNGYDVIKAKNGWQAFDTAVATRPDLILLDILMPEMDGYDTCVKLKDHPQTQDIPVIFVTGKLDEINEKLGFEYGAVDYIRKPISTSVVLARVKTHLAIREAQKQLQEMLSKTLLGTVSILNDILTFIDPTFQGMQSRLKRYVRDISNYLDLPDRWRLELAAMLSHIGCVVIPKETLEKINSGEVVSEDEQRMYDMHPSIAQNLIAKIPRMRSVAQIIGRQRSAFDQSKYTPEPIQWDPIDLGGQVLRTVIDYDCLLTRGLSTEQALSEMRAKQKAYAPVLLEALEATVKIDHDKDVRQLKFKDLQEGDILIEDVYTDSGALIIRKGRELTSNTLAMLQPFANIGSIKEPIKVK